METVKLENHSNAPVYLPHRPAPVAKGEKGEPYEADFTIVPRQRREDVEPQRKGEEKTFRNVPGTAEISAEFWGRLEKDRVVAAYLSAGRLRVVGSSPPPASAPSAGGKPKG